MFLRMPFHVPLITWFSVKNMLFASPKEIEKTGTISFHPGQLPGNVIKKKFKRLVYDMSQEQKCFLEL